MVSELRPCEITQSLQYGVLILVLVEDGLGVRAEIAAATPTVVVLILVLVEDGLGAEVDDALRFIHLQS